MGHCTLNYKQYHRPLKTALRTHHGSWQEREGILLQLINREGCISYGEIAPLPWFGSEPLNEAWNFLQALPREIEPLDVLASLPPSLPATRFGLESAWLDLRYELPESCVPLPCCGLLLSGEAALKGWQDLWQQGYRTLKWKIAVADLDQELSWLQQLLDQLPPEVRLRLDANGGLTSEQARRWLRHCQDPRIEYLEQPLPPGEFEEMIRLSQEFSTLIALDESVASFAQLQQCCQRGWQGVMVIKLGILGSPDLLDQLYRTYHLDLVMSSCLETLIGAYHVARYTQQCQWTTRALGYGLDHLFAGDEAASRLAFTEPLDQVRTRLNRVWSSL
ncbi:MAG: o-succinylbenzoate synthase [Synechococcaceae cyanobacterium SM2_3_1]|nr:o-succinylbenzoate synthase [Synechococcaceae cyanobacterium SM2_3_1]